MIVRILRRENPQSASFFQDFEYPCKDRERATVARILDDLNYNDDLFDVTGAPARRIRWECSCMQKICGGCAMIINGMPGLACGTFIEIRKTELLVLEPLSKFPVVSDLIVDRSIIRDHQIAAGQYLGSLGESDPGEYEQQYSAAKCLKCGLCLEVCPNYAPDSGRFFGAVLANESYLLCSMSGDRKGELRESYRRHFEEGCSKSLACRDVCPMRIQTLSSIGYMNRLKRKRP